MNTIKTENPHPEEKFKSSKNQWKLADLEIH
jgi:hypothetical protein